jgi:uracil-DNA glycosylase family 4
MCSLGEWGPNAPGIPTRRLVFQLGLPPKPKAVLFIGEAPGLTEDASSECWIGRSGRLLSSFIQASGILDLADVYLSNACRCMPHSSSKSPSSTCINACRPYLQADLDLLYSHYPSVTIMCCGKTASESVARFAVLNLAFHHQGSTLSFFRSLLSPGRASLMPSPTHDPAVFFTYHPAILLSNPRSHSKTSARQPALVRAVEDHFHLLTRYLHGETISFLSDSPLTWLTNPPASAIPAYSIRPSSRIFIDIETYGILSSHDQTSFLPVRSSLSDGVHPPSQIVSVAIRHPDTSTYFYYDRRHLGQVGIWLHLISKAGATLVGQNIKFDVSYLRAHHPSFRYWLDPRRIRLDDTLLLNHLTYEHRPERGLKELTLLFGIYDYSSESISPKSRDPSSRASGPYDPRLAHYNVVDCHNTFLLEQFLWSRIRSYYTPSSSKLSGLCADIRNWILWDVVLLEESGIFLDEPRLQALEHRLVRHMSRLSAFCASRGLLVSGPGSKSSKSSLISSVLFDKLHLTDDPRVLTTPKTRDISVGLDNLNLALSLLPKSDPSSLTLRAWSHHTSLYKLFSSYVHPLLHEPDRGILARRPNGLSTIYPYWYPMPSFPHKSTSSTTSSSSQGGTKQGRFAARSPAAQTFPSPIKSLIRSRFPNGLILTYDLSQIELRVPCILSGDPSMISEYRTGIDRHAQTALHLFPSSNPSSPTFRDHERQCGKTINFLVLYEGGAATARETILRDLGIDVPLSLCQSCIDWFNAHYPIFRSWQSSNLSLVRDTLGYLELPTGWSRYWGLGSSVNGKHSEIADFPIQTIAAQLMQCAQFHVHCDFLDHNLHSVIISNVQDSLVIDCYPPEEPIIDKIIEKRLTNPPLYRILLSIYGQDREIPILYSKHRTVA